MLAGIVLGLLGGCAGDKSGRVPLTPEEIMALPDARTRSIVLTHVELSNATIEEVVRYLTEQSREAEPEKKGVVIQFKNYRVHDVPWRVNLRLPQATVMQVLDQACVQTRCNYLIGKEVVTVMPEAYLKRAAPY